MTSGAIERPALAPTVTSLSLRFSAAPDRRAKRRELTVGASAGGMIQLELDKL